MPTQDDLIYKSAYDALTKAQQSRNPNDVAIAKNAIGALKGTGAEFGIGEFSKQLDGVQQGIDTRNAYNTDQASKIDSMYNSLKTSQLARAQVQKDSQVEALRRQLAQQLPVYQTQRAQADVGQQNNLSKLKEYMANSGAFNSGDNLSRASNIITNRANAVNQINGNENAYTIGIDNNIADAERSYNSDANQIASQYDAQKAQALMDLQNRLRQEDYQASRDNVLDNRYNQQFDYQKAQDTQNYNFDREKYANSINQWLEDQKFKNNQFDYTKQRDAVGDNQWNQQFNLSKGNADRDYQLQLQQLAISRANAAKASTPSTTQQNAENKANAQKLTGDIQTYLDSWASGKADGQGGRAGQSDMLNYIKSNSGILTQQGVDVDSLAKWVKNNYTWDKDSEGNWYKVE